jgi:peroxiredoxin
MKHIWIVSILLALGTTAALAGPAMPGKPAPEFTLTDTTGTAHSLSDFEGKYVVLEWTNYDCPFVRKHYGSGNMQKLQKEYTGKGAVWLSICSSAPGKQGHYAPEQWGKLIADREAKPTAVLLDADGKVGRAYGAKTTPHVFVIGPDGVVLYAGAIDSVRSANPADIADAENYVRSALDAVMADKPVSTPSTAPYGCSVKY